MTFSFFSEKCLVVIKCGVEDLFRVFDVHIAKELIAFGEKPGKIRQTKTHLAA